jgi:hypothetical protein
MKTETPPGDAVDVCLTMFWDEHANMSGPPLLHCEWLVYLRGRLTSAGKSHERTDDPIKKAHLRGARNALNEVTSRFMVTMDDDRGAWPSAWAEGATKDGSDKIRRLYGDGTTAVVVWSCSCCGGCEWQVLSRSGTPVLWGHWVWIEGELISSLTGAGQAIENNYLPGLFVGEDPHRSTEVATGLRLVPS